MWDVIECDFLGISCPKPAPANLCCFYWNAAGIAIMNYHKKHLHDICSPIGSPGAAIFYSNVGFGGQKLNLYKTTCATNLDYLYKGCVAGYYPSSNLGIPSWKSGDELPLVTGFGIQTSVAKINEYLTQPTTNVFSQYKGGVATCDKTIWCQLSYIYAFTI